MELGLLNSRCQGANLLHGAVHEKNGVVWSDGRGIYLAPVSVYQGEVENQQPTKLGEFNRGVKSIHWSEDIYDGFCYMCVVHDKNISIWKVEGHQPKLTFKQVRKVNIQPIQQGILWCPERDILCVLTPHQGSLYYSHIQNKGSHILLQLDKEKIRCGCWLPDGSKLVICVGTSLTVYSWSDIDSSLTLYNSVSWTIPGLDGPVSSIVPLSDNQVVCAAELPLESLCKQNNTFALPDLISTQSSLPEPNSLTDSDIIRPRQTAPSVKDVLLNLPINPQTDLEDSSYLILVCVHDNSDPEKVSGCKVKGILTPDILLYETTSQVIIVGSNTQTLLQIFDLEENKLIKSGEICLEKDERPKGISCLPRSVGQGHSDILILVGKKEPSDSAFLSSSNTTAMKSVLKMFSIKRGKGGEPKRPLTHTNSEPLPLNIVSNGNYGKHNGALSVFKNGSHGDIDTDRSGHGDTGQGQNGNKVQGYISDDFANLRSTETKSCVNLSAATSNGNKGQTDMVRNEQEITKCRSVENVNNNSERQSSAGPVPPKRPIRKKRSARGRNDLHEKVITQSKESLGKMPMEYSSSSPDVSPRLNSGHTVSTEKQQTDKIEKNQYMSKESGNLTSSNVDKAVIDKEGGDKASVKKENVDDKVLNKENDDKALVSKENVGNASTNFGSMGTGLVNKEEQSEVLNSSNSSGVSSVSKLSVDSKLDSSCEESPRDIPLIIGRNVTSNKSKIIEIGSEENKKELEIERVNFDSQKRNFERPNLSSSCFEDAIANEKVHSYLTRTAKSDASISEVKDQSKSSVGVPKSSEGISCDGGDNNYSVCQSRSDESLDDIDRQLKQQTEDISRLQEQISSLDRRINESTCVLPSRYQSQQNPELVFVAFRCKDGSEIKKKFLLDNRRLKLELVQQTFCLETVEIFIDDEPCVIGSNIDGYIPMRFDPGTTIHIIGKPSLTMV